MGIRLLRYKEFKPTPLDEPGVGLPEYQEWQVMPLAIDHSSSIADMTRFSDMVELLGGEQEKIVIVRLEHWYYGWIYLCLVHPDIKVVLLDVLVVVEDDVD